MIRKTPRFSKLTLSIFVAIFALSFIFLSGSNVFLKISIAEAADPAIGLTKDNPGIKRAIEVQGWHTERLMSIKGVVGHGIGISSDGKPAIKIFVERAGIPGIPLELEGIPTKVEVTGMVVAYADPTARFPRPVPIGVSTGHPDITAGTIGCRVTDGTFVYALSNNHIYANENDASYGDSALQPGPYDGGQYPADEIGTLDDFEPIDFSGGDNIIDAAIARSSNSYLGCSTPEDGYGTPGLATVEASLGQEVQKYGRTTGWTHGVVSVIDVTVDVCYQTRGPFRCVKLARFVDQIAITPGTFSAGGDSGSLVVIDDTNKSPVGLLFAGSSSYTFANRIASVLIRFGVTVDDCSGTCADPDGDGDDYDAVLCGGNDCDDTDPNVYPGATEVCDEVDNNCDGTIDEGCSTCTDADGDSYDAVLCGGNDCDDTDPNVYPGATEVCDEVDNNCNGTIDEGCSSCEPLGAACASDSECCSGKCKGRPGGKTCK